MIKPVYKPGYFIPLLIPLRGGILSLKACYREFNHTRGGHIIFADSSLSFMWYPFLNIFFFVFHTVFTLFNMVGWIFPKTRKLHLVTMLLTAGSWFVLGIWYGWGYCVCTDWHWQVREAMGYHDRSDSYIHFLLLKLTGKNFDPRLVEQATLIIFLLCFALGIFFFVKDRRKRLRKV